MAEPTLEFIQSMIQTVIENQHRAEEHLQNIDNRLIAQEQHMAAVHLDDHNIRVELTGIRSRLDRIEKRLGLIEA